MSMSFAAQAIRTPRSTVPIPALLRVGRETIVVAGAQVVSGVAGIATVSWLSTALAESQYGLYAFAVLLITLAQPVFYGVGAALVRYYGAALDAGTLRALLKAVWDTQRKRLILLATVLVALAGLCVAVQCESLTLPTIFFVFFCAAITSSGNLCDQLHTAARHRTPVAVHQIVFACLKFLLAGCVVTAVSASAIGAMIGIALAAAGTAGLQYLSYQRRYNQLMGQLNERIYAADWAGPVQRFSTPFIGWSIAVIVQQAADRLALFWCCTDAELGLYSAIAGISFVPAMLLFQCVGQVLRPIVFRHAGAGGSSESQVFARQQAAKITYLALCVAITLTLLAVVFRQTVFDLLLAKKYAAASPLLPLMVFNGCLFGCSQIAELQLMVVSRMELATRVRCVFAVLGVVTALPGALAGGVYGVSIVVAVVQLLGLVTLLGFVESYRFGGQP